ncbi:hypothetical protein RclHR1_14430006 [Rhizophagus clarus]|uniref:Uncharacterized protein n=1 Tax=Rhizophagus clarus TaxID=94130 RepID=A0A2Z6QT85_9GLOM|nr:hypothetical protein RclHR1_14430006 [Rhizophagus clarus]GES84421.1 hypothetical protein GLOIN_2v1485492 [Rhizophagus clarus]
MDEDQYDTSYEESDKTNSSDEQSSSDESSISERAKEKGSRKHLSKKRKLYASVMDMDKNLRDALRQDVFWIIQRLPENLDVSKTFEDQKEFVLKIMIPSIMNVLSRNTYPVTNNVIYQLIHQRHRHQRENEKDKNKLEEERKKQMKKKHANSRRSEKRKRRTIAINHLRSSKDKLINKFEKNDLKAITSNNAYHSPEISESDEGADENKILQQFLRGYLDEVTNQKSKGRNFKKRVWTYSDFQLVEEVNPPLNASKWTISGYNSPLKRLVASVHSDDEDEGDTEKDNGHEHQQCQRGHEHRQKKRKEIVKARHNELSDSNELLL